MGSWVVGRRLLYWPQIPPLVGRALEWGIWEAIPAMPLPGGVTPPPQVAELLRVAGFLWVAGRPWASGSSQASLLLRASSTRPCVSFLQDVVPQQVGVGCASVTACR